MPVIRKMSEKWSAELGREELLTQLVDELRGIETLPPRPVVFELPISNGESYHVIAVWDRWHGVPLSTRSDVLLQAYDEFEREASEVETIAARITIAIGATIQEALFQLHVLPHRIQATGAKQPGQFIEDEYRDRIDAAMTKEGAIVWEGRLGLFLPSEGMAEDAYRRLSDEFPDVRWHLSRTEED